MNQGGSSKCLQYVAQRNCGRHLCERNVGREDTVCYSAGKNWIAAKQCLEERSIDSAQFCTMYTCWNAAFWTPGRNVDHTQQILVPSIPLPSDHPHGKLLYIFNHFNFLTHARIPYRACI